MRRTHLRIVRGKDTGREMHRRQNGLGMSPVRAGQHLGSISLVVGAIQMNTTQRCHSTSNRWAKTQMFDNILCWGDAMKETSSPIHWQSE